MDNDDFVNRIIDEVNNNEVAFCKFLAVNDTIRATSHQCGIYIPNIAAEKLLFNTKLIRGANLRHGPVRINWQNASYQTDSMFIYYGAAKDECRITSFGRNFPFLRENDIGDLFILIKISKDEYNAYLLTTDDTINSFLDYFGMSPVDTNSVIVKKVSIGVNKKNTKELRASEEIDAFECVTPIEKIKRQEIIAFVDRIHAEFPGARVMSKMAREIYENIYDHRENVIKKPDYELIGWINLEYELFCSIEERHYAQTIFHGFKNMEDFIEIANSVLNRRKSRAGKSLENNLEELFIENNLMFESQVVTELNKKPDFVFPGSKAYHDMSFDNNKLVVLGAKTTCKDRWRQVITEADRVKQRYLCTLQQGNSPAQLKEMKQECVTLVVPKPYITTYPKEYREDIMDLATFIAFVKGKEDLIR